MPMAKPAPPSDDASEEEAPARAARLVRERRLKVLHDSSSSSEDRTRELLGLLPLPRLAPRAS